MDLSEKVLEILRERCILASYQVSPLINLVKLEDTSQFTLVQDPNSKAAEEILINKRKPVTLYDNFINFCDSNKKIQLTGDFLKLIPNCRVNVDNSKQ